MSFLWHRRRQPQKSGMLTARPTHHSSLCVGPACGEGAAFANTLQDTLRRMLQKANGRKQDAEGRMQEEACRRKTADLSQMRFPGSQKGYGMCDFEKQTRTKGNLEDETDRSGGIWQSTVKIIIQWQYQYLLLLLLLLQWKYQASNSTITYYF